MAFQTLDQADLQGKRALVRVDFNVPMEDGKVTDDTRLRAAAPTVENLRKGGAKVILLAHFDRPKGKVVPSMSLEPIVEPLSKVLGYPVAFAADCIGPVARAAVSAMQPGDEVLIYHTGDEKAVVGTAQVTKAAYPDPKKKDPKLVVVELRAGDRLPAPVALSMIRSDPLFKDLALVRMPRLSVVPASAAQWKHLLQLARRPSEE